jgi:regulator of replication initiation timing
MQSTDLIFAKIEQIRGCINALHNRIQTLKTYYNQIIDAVNLALKRKLKDKLKKEDFKISKEFKDLKHTI